jgi:hypothetical protein
MKDENVQKIFFIVIEVPNEGRKPVIKESICFVCFYKIINMFEYRSNFKHKQQCLNLLNGIHS